VLELVGGGVVPPEPAITEMPTCRVVRRSFTVNVAEPALMPLTVMTVLLRVALATEVFEELTLVEPEALLTVMFAVAPSINAMLVADNLSPDEFEA
jgi:hypothetical protein